MNEILYFDALQWYVETENGVTTDLFEYDFYEKRLDDGAIDEKSDWVTFRNSCESDWIFDINATIKPWNKKGYKVLNFNWDKGILEASGPKGRDKSLYGHIKHRVTVVLEKSHLDF